MYARKRLDHIELSKWKSVKVQFVFLAHCSRRKEIETIVLKLISPSEETRSSSRRGATINVFSGRGVLHFGFACRVDSPPVAILKAKARGFLHSRES